MTNIDEGDWIDGRWIAPLVVDQDHVLTGTHQGSVRVAGGHFMLAGILQGSLSICGGATATIKGRQQGSISVASTAAVVVTGAIEGSVSVERGATVTVEAGGKLAGSLHNDGIVVVRGVFGGSRSGTGDFRLEGDGYIKQPKVVDGVYYYEW